MLDVVSQARRALASFNRGDFVFGGSSTPLASLTTTESYAVEIGGLDTSKTVSSVLDELAAFEKDLKDKVIVTHRHALVRFPRASHVSATSLQEAD